MLPPGIKFGCSFVSEIFSSSLISSTVQPSCYGGVVPGNMFYAFSA